jgi:acetyltransferase EpsM
MKLGLIGVNPITQIVINIQKQNQNINTLCIYDDDMQKHGNIYYDVKVDGSLDEIERHFLDNNVSALHICLGEKHLSLKKDIFNKYKKIGLQFPNFIDPSCLVSPTSTIGEGNVLSFGIIIGHNTIINSNNSIWAGAIIEHDCILHGHSYIGPNVTISGFVEIGECSLIGSGAVILPEIKIGHNCIVGAGAVVTKDIPNNSIVKGNPAR